MPLGSALEFRLRMTVRALNRGLQQYKQAFGATNKAPNYFTPLFVGGAPRTGTTALHALICTSPKTNGYIAECSYFSAFMQPLLVGIGTFDIHTKHYFDTRESFLQYHGSIMTGLLSDFWQWVGRPELLALKDPLLTPHFHWLAKILKGARFVVVARDPYDTISSRLEVMRRQKGSSDITNREVQEVCLEYANTYRAILDNADAFGERLCIVNYEALVAGKEFPKLEAFGIAGMRPDRLWLDAVTDVTQYSDNEWLTPLYGETLTTESIGRHRHRLTPEVKSIIFDTCGVVARELCLAIEG